MIRPPGLEGVVFTQSLDGDIKGDPRAREALCEHAGIPTRWATAHQVHGAEVVFVTEPGEARSGDAIWTTERGLPVSVFTADCFGVVLKAVDAIGVAHAGWRGARSGVVAKLRSEMESAGHETIAAAAGPGIGGCCFEVGREVLKEFPGHESITRWGTDSVDLRSALRDQLEGLDTWFAEDCTHHGDGSFSHRRDKTSRRMAAVGWLT